MIKGMFIIKYNAAPDNLATSDSNVVPKSKKNSIKNGNEGSGKKAEKEFSLTINIPLELQDESSEEKQVKYNWRIHVGFQLLDEERPPTEILEEIITRFIEDPSMKKLNFRHFPYKYYVLSLPKTDKSDEQSSFILIYMMNINESLDIMRVANPSLSHLVSLLNQKEKLKIELEQVIEAKNKLLDKLENPQILQSEIGNKANQLIDEGNFEDAQNLIKLAKELPPKLVNSYKAGLEYLKNKDYRKAEKSMADALELAEKIHDLQLITYLNARIHNTREIPVNQKTLKSLMSSLNRTLGKTLNLPNYNEIIPKIHKLVEVLEKLEKDAQLERAAELESVIEHAKHLIDQIKHYEQRIKGILNNF